MKLSSSSLVLSFCMVILIAMGCRTEVDDSAASGDTPEVVAGESSATENAPDDEPRRLVPAAEAAMQPLADSGVSGTVQFSPSELGLQVSYQLEGLSEGAYGIHVHENGSCAEGEDGSPGGAAGGHFNPGGAPHGAPNDPEGQRHVGDLGNIHVRGGSMIYGSFSEELATLDGENGIVGRALVIHAGRDDFASQPSGDAGARIACGIISSIGA